MKYTETLHKGTVKIACPNEHGQNTLQCSVCQGEGYIWKDYDIPMGNYEGDISFLRLLEALDDLRKTDAPLHVVRFKAEAAYTILNHLLKRPSK